MRSIQYYCTVIIVTTKLILVNKGPYTYLIYRDVLTYVMIIKVW